MSLVKHAFVLQVRKKWSKREKKENHSLAMVSNGPDMVRTLSKSLVIISEMVTLMPDISWILLTFSSDLPIITLASLVNTMDLMATMGGMSPSNPSADSSFDLAILFCKLSSINVKIMYMLIKNNFHWLHSICMNLQLSSEVWLWSPDSMTLVPPVNSLKYQSLSSSELVSEMQ